MSDAAPKLPRYAIFFVRLGISPTDWYEFEACLESRYQEVLSNDGPAVASKWLREECIWIAIEGVKRLLRGGF
jgi:hypothetical protein